jgi:hypothetical protein
LIRYIAVILVIIFMDIYIPSAQEVIKISLPDIAAVKLKPYAKLNFAEIDESSGIVKSRLWKNVYWTHNDSGDKARIFPITRDGEIIKPDWAKDYQGILIPNAVNVDWESITTDNQGNLIIGDTGNNSNTRRDLTLYIVKEPYPWETVNTSVFQSIKFSYQDLREIPPAKLNYDAEAVFWRNGKLYMLTKHRSDDYTTLYVLDSPDLLEENTARMIQEFDSHGRVTDADASADGKRILMLTLNGIWMFQPKEDSENIFLGEIYWLPIEADQCESICFDGNKIIVGNEQTELFEVDPADLIKVTP